MSSHRFPTPEALLVKKTAVSITVPGDRSALGVYKPAESAIGWLSP
jgi:hypothetical protein